MDTFNFSTFLSHLPSSHPRPHKQPARQALKAALRLAINKSKSITEARRLNRIRAKMLSGVMTETEAIIAWMDLTLEIKRKPVIEKKRYAA